DVVWCRDERGHVGRKFSADGKLLQTLGSGQPADTGIEGMDYRTITRPGPPFNMPTNVAIAPGGELYITDGYGNARVHKFSAEGKLLFSWGEAGDGPGQFNLPHGSAIERAGRGFVAGREKRRLPRFSHSGKFLNTWDTKHRPH